VSASNVDKKEERASKNGVIPRSVRDQCLKKLEGIERRLDDLAKKLGDSK